jgi:hypothetical protein
LTSITSHYATEGVNLKALLDVFRDSIWTPIIGIAAIVFTLFVYRWQKVRKVLSYNVITNQSLLTVHEEAKGEIKILYNGNEIKNPRMMIISVKNTGNTPVREEDYVEPLSFVFSSGVEMLAVEMIDRKPEYLKIVYKNPNSSQKNILELAKLLLNAKDQFTIKFILANAPLSSNCEMRARIVGCSIQQAFSPGGSPSWKSQNIIFLVFMLGIGNASWMAVQSSNSYTSGIAFLISLVVALGLCVALYRHLKKFE